MMSALLPESSLDLNTHSREVLDVRLLGPIEVRVGDPPPVKLTEKLRLLVAVLALNGNAVVSAGQLVEELWPEDAPPAANALQAHVSRLRRLLDDGRSDRQNGQRLVSRPPGYTLFVAPGECDVYRFKDLRNQAHRATLAGHHQTALELLHQALGLWRGDACQDASGPTCVSAASQLADLRLATTIDLMDTKLRVGMHALMIPELQELIAMHPLEETLHDLLMVAFHRTGHHSQALAVYGRLRLRLARTIGISPSPALEKRMRSILESVDEASVQSR